MTVIANNGPTSITTPAPTPSASTSFEEASPAQVRQWMRSGEVVLIDVRE